MIYEKTVDLLTNEFIDSKSITILIMLCFFIAFFAWLLTTIGNFFPEFFATVTKKYKLKKNIDIDYNRDFNVDHTAKLLKYLTKREIKKNHGKRLPFRR